MSELATIKNDTVAAITPMSLIETAMSQNADIDKLEKLWKLQQRYEQAEARKAYVSAMAKFRNECPAIKKTKQGHNTRYAGLAETIAQIRDAESACGLTHNWVTNQANGVIEVTCTITHTLGHSESTTLISPPETSGSKNSIQAIGSAVTYLQRYTLFAILGIASSDDDLDGQDSFDGDCVSAMQKCETKAELQAMWNSFSRDQQDENRPELYTCLEAIK